MSEPTTEVEANEVIDARGLQCPMPLVRASQAVKKIAPGEIVKVLATDRSSMLDFQAWIKNQPEYTLLKQEQEMGEDGKTIYIHYIKRVS